MATDWAALREFYVYDLIDPRDLCTFYVGKGQGDRVGQHLRESLAGRFSNTAKHERIMAIVAAGLRPIEAIISTFDDEAEAIRFEERRIDSFGLANLTNIMARGNVSHDIMREAEETANEIISRAEREIRRQQSPELVAFGRDWLETGKLLLAKIVAIRYPDGCLPCH